MGPAQSQYRPGINSDTRYHDYTSDDPPSGDENPRPSAISNASGDHNYILCAASTDAVGFGDERVPREARGSIHPLQLVERILPR